jgi:hypothetical protein
MTMHDIAVVMTNPLDNRHDDFNDWYSNIHIRDVMRLPGAIAVQRFVLSADQLPEDGGVEWSKTQYLAIYESYDIEKNSYAHRHVFTPAMIVSNSIDLDHEGYYFSPLALRQNESDALLSGDVLIEQLAPAIADAAFVADYAEHRMAAMVALPGIKGGMLVRAAEHQMVPSRPARPYIGIYRLSDRQAALAAVAAAGLDRPPASAKGSILMNCFEPMFDRLTADEVIHPTAAGEAAEAAARAAIGDRLYTAADVERWKDR